MTSRRAVALAMSALYLMMALLAVVVTDFFDREWPQQLDVKARITVGFELSPLQDAAAIQAMSEISETFGLGLYKLAPDLVTTNRQVLVAMDPRAADGESLLEWFGPQEPAAILDVSRLDNSFADGTYLVTDETRLSEAIEQLEAQGVAVHRTDAALLATLARVGAESGFAAALISACLLVGAMTLYWLAGRARSRALRVLAGAAPWRVHLQDIGAYLVLLLVTAVGVAALACVTVGVVRGWIYVVPFAHTVLVLASATALSCVCVVVLASRLAWPSPDLFAYRVPAVSTLRRPTRVVQVLTLVALLAFAAPAWRSTQEAELTALQLSTWNELADQVALSFAMSDEDLNRIAPAISELVDSGEADGQVALSYSITEEQWEGNFGPYSSISIVNDEWLSVVGQDKEFDLVAATDPDAPLIFERELGPTLELTRAGLGGGVPPYGDLEFLQPNEVSVPVDGAGARGDLSFADDVLIVVTPTIATLFDPENTVSLATGGNLIFEGIDATQAKLQAVGLDRAGLSSLGVDGSLRPVYMAEEGILEAQYATYRARLLTLSLAAVVSGFLLASWASGMIGANLNARRDFPLRLGGATWNGIVWHRTLRDQLLAVVACSIVILSQFSNVQLIPVTVVVAVVALAIVQFSNVQATRITFSLTAQRKM